MCAWCLCYAGWLRIKPRVLFSAWKWRRIIKLNNNVESSKSFYFVFVSSGVCHARHLHNSKIHSKHIFGSKIVLSNTSFGQLVYTWVVHNAAIGRYTNPFDHQVVLVVNCTFQLAEVVFVLRFCPPRSRAAIPLVHPRNRRFDEELAFCANAQFADATLIRQFNRLDGSLNFRSVFCSATSHWFSQVPDDNNKKWTMIKEKRLFICRYWLLTKHGFHRRTHRIQLMHCCYFCLTHRCKQPRIGRCPHRNCSHRTTFFLRCFVWHFRWSG